jgi:hypothetical protein
MKFSIRDLFLVTMIVALSVGWGVDHWRQAGAVDDARFLADVVLNDISHDDLPRLRETCKKYGVKAKGDVSIHLQELPDSSAPVPTPSKP